MPSIVNPMDALKTFEPALKRGALEISRGTVHPELLVHVDRPMGETRVTYARMRGEAVGAMAIVIPSQSLDGVPVFQIGYAVPQHLRKRGLAKEVARAAVDEFTADMARSGVRSFYLEAVVGTRNIASRKVAEQVIGGDPREVIDQDSGEAALQYVRKIGDG